MAVISSNNGSRSSNNRRKPGKKVLLTASMMTRIMFFLVGFVLLLTNVVFQMSNDSKNQEHAHAHAHALQVSTSAVNAARQPPFPQQQQQQQQQQALKNNSTSEISGLAALAGHATQMSVSATKLSESSSSTTGDLAIILFTHLKTTDRFDNLIFPALDTWWTNDETDPMYIVMTPQWKDAYAAMCHEEKNVKYCQRIFILWVDCPEGKFGESPCCKQEKGLLALPKPYDWTFFADDDVYFKISPFRNYLSWVKLNPNDVLIITSGGLAAKYLGAFGYLGRNSPYKCSTKPEYRYPWGQPVIYSHAALKLILPGLRAGGLVKQCIEFNVTHDTGNSIFHWMYGIPDYAIKVHMIATDKPKLEAFGVHGIHRYVEDAGKLITMWDVHNGIYHNNETTRITSFTRYMKTKNHRAGFLQTDIYAKYGDPSTWGNEWHTMPKRDCMDKEMKEKTK